MKKLATSAVAAAALILAPATATATTQPETTDEFTILATTDLHGHMVDWDYFVGEPFGAEDPEDARGLDRLATAISEVRAEKGEDSVLLVDNGDANQGNPLQTYYHQERKEGTVDPVASVFNYLKYDAGTVGNHEFNYDLDDLQQYAGNLNMPLLGANVIEVATGEPYLKPYEIISKETVNGQTIDIGVIGLVTPGVRIWDRGFVEGILEFQDVVVAAEKWVPVVEEQADVVVVLAHTGLNEAGYVWDPADLNHDVGTSLAENVPGIDVIIGGHSHSTRDVQQYFTNSDGGTVLWSQPGYHGRFLANVTVPIIIGDDGEPTVSWTEELRPTAEAMHAPNYAPHQGVIDAAQPWHDGTNDWVATKVATATETMSGATSPWEDTPILDFVNKVQTEEVERGLAGTEYEGIPVLAEASPFSRNAVFPEGDVTIANMAGLYTFDNTLLGVELTGAQVKDYLEWSARYYVQQEPGAEIEDWSTVTNASDGNRNIPDYALDVLSGVNYHVNISQPVGERIENLSHPDGTPVADDDRFILAINNYRQSGGQNYPHVANAPVRYDEVKSIRDLMIDWAIQNEVINPDDFFVENWTLSTSSVEVEEPTEPTEPTTPVEPTEPTTPVEPTEPPTPTEPTDPVSPTPVDDDDTVKPAPQDPSDPVSPDEENLSNTGAAVRTIIIIAIVLLVVGGLLSFLRRRGR